jgi:hypothetical protein
MLVLGGMAPYGRTSTNSTIRAGFAKQNSYTHSYSYTMDFFYVSETKYNSIVFVYVYLSSRDQGRARDYKKKVKESKKKLPTQIGSFWKA